MSSDAYSPFPTSFHHELLHADIRFGNIQRVSRTISLHPNEKYFFDTRLQSASFVALKLKRLDIYELLISKGCHLGPIEDLNEVIDWYSFAERVRIREIHKKYSKEPIAGYIELLISRSKLSHDTRDQDRDKCFQLIRNALEEISEFLFIRPILDLVSRSESISIIFDFNRPTISTVDPTKAHYVTATSYYLMGEIYVGAQLLMTNDASEVLATLAHEFCHLAMNMVYRNRCKPYFKTDVEKEMKFGEILRICEKNKDVNTALWQVYECPDDNQHAELIVAVPFLLVYYRNNPEKYLQCLEKFPELFEFYENHTLVDLKHKINSLVSHEKLRKIRSFDETEAMLKSLKISLDSKAVNISLNLDNASHVSSNCPLLTCKHFYSKFNANNDNFLFVFNTLENLNTTAVIKQVKSVVDSCPVIKIVVLYDDQEVEKINTFFKHVVENSLEKTIILVTHSSLASLKTPSNFQKVQEYHLWNQLTAASKNRLIQRNVNFQGLEVKLSDLIKKPAMEMVKSTPLNKLVLKQEIKIGRENVFDTPSFYIERKLVDRSNQTSSQTINEVIEMRRDGRDFLICDEPGMGKTTAFQIIAMKLKTKHPSYWIQFVDLKGFTNVFRQNKHKSLEKQIDLIEFIQVELFKIKEFEADVCAHLFTKNRVIFFFDGFDEVCPTHKTFVLNLFRSIKLHSMNQLWITTRPRWLNDLNEVLKFDVIHNLKPFDQNDRKEFLEKFFNPNHEPNTMKIKKILDFLESDSLKGNFSNPLLLKMIADVVEELEELEEDMTPRLNLFSTYNEFFSLFVARSFTKGLEASIAVSRLMERSSPKSILQKFAVQKVFPETYKGMSSTAYKTNDENEETLVRLGITYTDEFGSIQFIHQTFAEFFVADFIFNNLFSGGKLNENVALADAVFGEVLKSSVDHVMIEVLINDMISPMNLETIKGYLSSNLTKYEIDFNQLIKYQCFNLINVLAAKQSVEYSLANILKANPEQVLIDSAKFMSLNEFELFFYDKLKVDKRKRKMLMNNKGGESFKSVIRKREIQNELPSNSPQKLQKKLKINSQRVQKMSRTIAKN